MVKDRYQVEFEDIYLFFLFNEQEDIYYITLYGGFLNMNNSINLKFNIITIFYLSN